MSKEQKKPYKTLLGNRIYVKVDIPTYSVQMSESAKKAITDAAAKTLQRAVVYDVGTGVPESVPIKKGDEVMVSKEGIMRGDLVNLSPDLSVIIVSPFEIVHIW